MSPEEVYGALKGEINEVKREVLIVPFSSGETMNTYIARMYSLLDTQKLVAGESYIVIGGTRCFYSQSGHFVGNGASNLSASEPLWGISIVSNVADKRIMTAYTSSNGQWNIYNYSTSASTGWGDIKVVY